MVDRQITEVERVLELLTSSLLESLVQEEAKTPCHHKVAATPQLFLLFLYQRSFRKYVTNVNDILGVEFALQHNLVG